MTRALEVVSHTAAWATAFASERARLGHALRGVAARVDHFGSTAVLGLAAKPTIDIQVSVPSLQVQKACASALEQLGYSRRSDSGDDSMPFFYRPDAWPHRFHVHVVESGSVEEARPLAFRDYLRDHSEVAREYEDMKRLLAPRYAATDDGHAAYARAKTHFVRMTTDRAMLEGYPHSLPSVSPTLDFGQEIPISGMVARSTGCEFVGARRANPQSLNRGNTVGFFDDVDVAGRAREREAAEAAAAAEAAEAVAAHAALAAQQREWAETTGKGILDEFCLRAEGHLRVDYVSVDNRSGAQGIRISASLYVSPDGSRGMSPGSKDTYGDYCGGAWYTPAEVVLMLSSGMDSTRTSFSAEDAEKTLVAVLRARLEEG